MASLVRPTYQTIVDQALRTTGAATGWLLAVTDRGLRVTATAGLAADRDLVGTELAITGAQGYVLSSGQPAALMPQPADAANNGAAGFDGVPISVVALPCGEDLAVGVLELAEKAGAVPFTFDDIEALATLASVAGAALQEDADVSLNVVSPAELSVALEHLAARHPLHYAATARLIELMLGRGA